MREFPSLAAVPDFHSVEAVPQLPNQAAVADSFGEFQEVRLQAVPAVPSPPSPATRDSSPPLVLSAREREEIVGELLGRDISSLVLTPLQRLAIIQENRARERGFPPFSPASDKTTLPSSSSFNNPITQQIGQTDSDFNTFESKNQNHVEENNSFERFRSQQISQELPKRPKPFKRPALTFLPAKNEEGMKIRSKPTIRSKNKIRIKIKNQLQKKLLTSQEVTHNQFNRESFPKQPKLDRIPKPPKQKSLYFQMKLMIFQGEEQRTLERESIKQTFRQIFNQPPEDSYQEVNSQS